MKKGLYVCIEGLDGSGKSTLVRNIIERLSTAGSYRYSTIRSTKPVDTKNPVEMLYQSVPILSRSSFCRALVYAYRSFSSTRSTDWSNPLIIGDRSIITSYVTRWRKWFNSPALTVAFVDLLEPYIYAPDHVIYLDASPDTLALRLARRGAPTDIDETRSRSAEMRKAYHEIRNNGKVIKRLTGTRWHVINAEMPEHEVLELAWEIIQGLMHDSWVRPKY